MLLIYFILVFLIILFFVNYNCKDKFINYKKQLVTFNPAIKNPPTIYYKENDLNNILINYLKNSYPSIPKKIDTYSKINELLDKEPNSLALTTLYDMYNDINKMKQIKKNVNIQFVCTLFQKRFIILTKNHNSNLQDNTVIYCEFKDSGMEYLLKKLKNIINFKIVFLNKEIKITNLNEFTKYENIALFTLDDHKIYKEFLKKNYKELSINNDYLKSISESLYTNVMYHNTHIDNNTVIICNKDLKEEYSYDIIDIIYINLNFLRNLITKKLLISYSSFYRSDILKLPKKNAIKIHSGTKKYLIYKGFINYS